MPKGGVKEGFADVAGYRLHFFIQTSYRKFYRKLTPKSRVSCGTSCSWFLIFFGLPRSKQTMGLRQHFWARLTVACIPQVRLK